MLQTIGDRQFTTCVKVQQLCLLAKVLQHVYGDLGSNIDKLARFNGMVCHILLKKIAYSIF